MGRRAAAPEWDAARTGMEMLPQKWLFWSEISPFSNTELFPPQTIFSLKTTASCQVWGGRMSHVLPPKYSAGGQK